MTRDSAAAGRAALWAAGWLALVPALTGLPGSGSFAAAQQGPPAPLPPRPLALPAVAHAALSNGARVQVMPDPDHPLVAVELVLPGGTARDPDGGEGAAALLARLMVPPAPGVLEALGAELVVRARADHLAVTLHALASTLEPALVEMARAVTAPTWTEDRVAAARSELLRAVRAESGSWLGRAQRTFLDALYGDHPLGRTVAPASVRILTPELLRSHHRAVVVPAGAWFSVAGGVTHGDAVAALEAAFGGWRGDVAPAPLEVPAPNRAGTEVVVVHRPGSPRAEVRLGQLVHPGSPGEWRVLSVARHLLEEELAAVGADRPEGLPGDDPRVLLGRREAHGYLEVEMAVPVPGVEEALTRVVRVVDRVRDRLADPDRVEALTARLAGAYPRDLETPRQRAARLAANRLLGLPEDALVAYPERIRALDPETVRQVFRRHVDPGRMAVVVVGDAGRLRTALASFGPVSVVDADGGPLAEDDLVAGERSVPLSAAGLEPVTLDYGVEVAGRPAGSIRRTLAVGDSGTLRFSSVAELGSGTLRQEVTVGAAELDLRSSRATVEGAGASRTVEVEHRRGRLVGAVTAAGIREPFSLPVPRGVMVGDMLELAVWVAELEDGAALELPVADVTAGQVRTARLQVTGREEITVPAGRFEVYRVRVRGAEPQTLWVRVTAPHLVVQIQPEGQPILVRLTGIRPGAGDRFP